MELTETQKTSLIGAMGVTGVHPHIAIRNFIADEGLQGQITPREARQQTMQTHRPQMMEVNGTKFIERYTTNVCGLTGLTVEQCDSIIAALQDAEVLIEAKKAEL